MIVVVVGIALLLAQVWSATVKATTPEAAASAGGLGDDSAARASVISLAANGGGALDRRRIDEAEVAEGSSSKTCLENNFAGGSWGRVVLLVVAILFTFNGLAIVCDEFFQASLEKISEVYI